MAPRTANDRFRSDIGDAELAAVHEGNHQVRGDLTDFPLVGVDARPLENIVVK